MNKYLEKIAARMSAVGVARSGTDVYELHGAIKKKTKKKKPVKTTPTANPNRRFNRSMRGQT